MDGGAGENFMNNEDSIGLFFLIVFMAIICFCLVAGCSTQKPLPVVYDLPTIKLPAAPPEFTQGLNDKSTPDEVVKAWVASSVAYKSWMIAVKRQFSPINLKR